LIFIGHTEEGKHTQGTSDDCVAVFFCTHHKPLKLSLFVLALFWRWNFTNWHVSKKSFCQHFLTPT